ncbi:MAG TPA: YihY/virulence factor BrkB family protein [Acidimicrobiales bacterium]|nr:YihY/virulence factor BrkB family protein [Acidimicrobiales bacterium]
MARSTKIERVVGAGLLAAAAVAVWRGGAPGRGGSVSAGAASDPDAAPSGPLAPLDRLQRRTPWLGFVLGVVKRFGEHGAGRLAAVISYYAFFSIFPLLLAFVTILGFVLEGDEQLRQDLVDSAIGQIPLIGSEIADSAGALTGNGVALAVGLGGALWAGMGAMLAGQHAMNTVWDVPRYQRPKLPTARLRALGGLAVLGVGVIGSTAVAGLVTAVEGLPVVGRLGLLAANLAVNIGVLALAFRVLTAERLTWRQVLPGAVVGAVGYVALQNLGTFLVDRFVTGASDTYGTFAVVIGLLSWFHLLAQVTVFAAEVNVVRARQMHPRSWAGGALTDGDQRALASTRRAAELDARAVG